jgi:hypothetical protein
MSKEIELLRAAVEENKSVTESAITLINGIAERVKAAADSGDIAAVATLANDLSAETTALADAVKANTLDAAPAAEAPASDAPQGDQPAA